MDCDGIDGGDSNWGCGCGKGLEGGGARRCCEIVVVIDW